MAQCDWINECPFLYNKQILIEAMREIYKGKYCQADYPNCARFLIFKALGPSKVPLNLFPNQRDRAKKIIETGG
jgi:hypothetical protein